MFDRYDVVVSLGGSCESAHHIRRLGTKQAFPLDWWITPFASVQKLFRERFSGLFNASNMEILGDGMAVRCRHFGVIHHHDFKRDEFDRVISNAVPDQLENLREKYQALTTRMFGLCEGRRVLFVRAFRDILHAPADYPAQLGPDSDPVDFDDLIDAIQKAMPTADFRVLFVNYGTHRTSNPRALFADVQDHGDIVDWTGSQIGWDVVFQGSSKSQDAFLAPTTYLSESQVGVQSQVSPNHAGSLSRTMSEPIGYDYNDGGINNQKLALLGLVVAAAKGKARANRRFYLPKIHNKDQHETRSSRAAFEDVFWLDMFADFARRWDIEIVEAPNKTYADRIEWGGWTYFGSGAGHLGTIVAEKGTDVNDDISADFFRSLVPRVRSNRVFQAICTEIYSRRKVSLVSQFRIEEDWYHYSNQTLSVTVKEPEDYYLAPERIAAKIKNTFPAVGPNIYVTCDERYIFEPKWTMKDRVREMTGLEIILKSDLISVDEFEALRPIDTSLLDFEIAKLAGVFVGLTRSTFSNLLCFERSVTQYRAVGEDYIYNVSGPRLGRRNDLGTQDSPQGACR